MRSRLPNLSKCCCCPRLGDASAAGQPPRCSYPLSCYHCRRQRAGPSPRPAKHVTTLLAFSKQPQQPRPLRHPGGEQTEEEADIGGISKPRQQAACRLKPCRQHTCSTFHRVTPPHLLSPLARKYNRVRSNLCRFQIFFGDVHPSPSLPAAAAAHLSPNTPGTTARSAASSANFCRGPR